MNKEILDLIIQIGRSDFKDRLGRELINDKAYINLVNKFKDSIDNTYNAIDSLCMLQTQEFTKRKQCVLMGKSKGSENK